MDEFIEKMPNWLRYVLAVPYGILMVIIFSIIVFISNYLFSSEKWQYISGFLYKNGINILIFFESFNFIIPKYNFQFTLTLCIIGGIFYSMIMGMSLMQGSLNSEYIIAYIEVLICLIISCILSFKHSREEKIEKEEIEILE